MTYEEFKAGVGEYIELVDKGLKKQANKLLFEFVDGFKANVSENEADGILYLFCRDILEDGGYPKFREFGFRGTSQLPFQLTGLMFDYLMRECERNKMPQMRWEYQLFGKYYNPHDPKNEHNPYEILERAYVHPECDQLTVDLYFNAQLDELGFGAHHFPDGCCIAREYYEECVGICEKILAERQVHEGLAAEYRYYKVLYELWYKWNDGGRAGGFCELCKQENLEFAPVQAFYYS